MRGCHGWHWLLVCVHAASAAGQHEVAVPRAHFGTAHVHQSQSIRLALPPSIWRREILRATQSRESSGAAHVGAQPAPHSSTSASLTQYATVAGSVLFSCSVALQRSALHATPVTAAASAAGCDAAHARSARKSPRGRSGSQYLRAGRGSACAYLLMLLWM